MVVLDYANGFELTSGMISHRYAAPHVVQLGGGDNGIGNVDLIRGGEVAATDFFIDQQFGVLRANNCNFEGGIPLTAYRRLGAAVPTYQPKPVGNTYPPTGPSAAQDNRSIINQAAQLHRMHRDVQFRMIGSTPGRR
jgi:hypothetical protein